MWLYMLFIATVILLLVAFEINKGDILAPSVVVCAVFLLSELFAVVNINKWEIDYSDEAAWLLILGISIFVLCDMLSRGFYFKHRIILGKYGKKDRMLEYIDIDSNIVVLAILFSTIMLPLYYLSLRRIASASGLSGSITVIMKSLTYMSDRSTDTTQSSWMSALYKVDMALGYVFTYVYLNNRAILKKTRTSDKKNNRLIVIPIMYLFATLFQGSRLQILLFIVFAFVVTYIQTQRLNMWKRRVSRKYLRIAVGLMVIILPGFYFILDLLGRSKANLSIMDYLAIYVGGSIQHFSQFVKDPVANTGVWGKECFYSIYNLLWRFGLYPQYISPHLEFRLLYQIGSSGSMVYRGNVYTFFRSPLSDFGILGMCVVTIIVGLFYSGFYFNAIYKKAPGHFTLVVYAYLFAQLSMISIANQITIMVSAYGALNIIMFYIVLKVVQRYSKRTVIIDEKGSIELK